MEKIVQLIESVGAKVGGLLKLNFDALYIGIACIALALIILVLIIVIIAVSCKKRKKKKAAKVVAEKPVVKDEQPTPVEPAKAEEQPATEEVKVETPVATETVKEEEKEEKVEVKEETVTPVVEKEKPVQKPAPDKKPAVKKSAPNKTKAEPKVEKAPAKKLNGKWSVEVKGAGEYISKLSASNGEVMLSSEIYTTEEGARNGIATIIKGVETGNFVIYQDKNKNYYYKLKTAGNRLLCVGEIYKSKEQCLKAVESVKRIAKDSLVMNELVEGAKYAEYTPAPIESKGMRGKWRIEKTEEGKFTARLYANNGQLMLATEEVALEKSAKNAIESVKKNSAEGNFIIDHDKFGRFYYKLRNAQKSVICIGEAYDTLESCTSAIESVRRFAANAVMVEE